MIAEEARKQLNEALKAKEVIKLNTMRMLLSAFNYKQIELQRDLTEEDEMVVVRAEAKKRKDAIEALRQARGKATFDSSRVEVKIRQEQKELEILNAFLPKQMGERELLDLVGLVIKDLGASNATDVGRVIGEVVKRAQGKADGKKVAEIVRQKL